ncbi:single-stranded DNA-binding protein [Selenomonas flueggei]|jgi:single-strand DNA-binding protein|uniref:single-stranded DNA-binding protein n=1 Tax=Selenomonas flueggei TaxID=135080 RepID=UPI002671DD40|nr:single-stranded DNA-binding protein [Selenomonas flueggei]
MNHFVGIGRLTRDPEVRYTQSGKACAKFTLAIDRRGNGEKQADFIQCVAWEKIAEVISQYTGKGRKIAVEGRIQTRSYDANDGSKRYVTEVVVQSMEFCDSKGGQQLSDAKEFGGTTVPDDDIPF